MICLRRGFAADPSPRIKRCACSPTRGERGACCICCDQACGLLAAALSRVRLMRGWRAERRKPWCSRSDAQTSRGRLAARHCGDYRYAGPAFAAPCPAARPGPSLTGQTAFGVGRRVVSQLLAGPRNGPGGSPAPPRVFGLRSRTRGDTAPRPASRRLVMRPLEDEVRCSVSEVWRAGISSSGTTLSSCGKGNALSRSLLLRGIAGRAARAWRRRHRCGRPGLHRQSE